jgi:nitrate/TMAO reductase-like tetraheme cytochrome c subunit
MKFIELYDEECGSKLILDLKAALEGVEAFFFESDHGDKCHLKIVEMTEEEYDELPESIGC